MKILTVKEFLEQQKSSESMPADDMNDRIGRNFVALLGWKEYDSEKIIFNKNEPGCRCIKLRTMLPESGVPPVTSIYDELMLIISENNLSQIIVKGFSITPAIIDVNDKNKLIRGILIYLKYIK